VILIGTGFVGDGDVVATEIEGGVEKAEVSPIEAAPRAKAGRVSAKGGLGSGMLIYWCIR
jgi:hypothetical protein